MASECGYTTAANIKKIILGVEKNSPYDNDTNIDFQITRAERIINNAFAARYTVPFTTNISLMITEITNNLAAYLIMRTIYTRDNVNVNKWVTTFKSDAEDAIKRIMERKEILVDSTGAVVAENEQAVESTTQNYTPTFNVDSDLNWAIDSDKLDDIADERD